MSGSDRKSERSSRSVEDDKVNVGASAVDVQFSLWLTYKVVGCLVSKETVLKLLLILTTT